ncbi:MAG: DUF1549 and DUF1553 domain-containing protein [Pirellulales bacterium]
MTLVGGEVANDRSTEAESLTDTFWAFGDVRDEVPPQVENERWILSPIDRFVLAALESHNLQPAAPADKHVLLRRVTFDLIGLPPTTQEIADFLADDSPDAFARVIDRLLASPHYGERWGRHWLDLLRFAETNGYEFDSDKPNAFHFRNYVIEALNRDLPFDRFVREQIAGDLLPDQRVSTDGTQVISKAGTGWLWMQEMLNFALDWPLAQAEEVENQLDVLGKAFLGLTVACARCHDHKFDPISTEEYYGLAGIIMSTTNVQECIDSAARRSELHQHLKLLRENEHEIRGIVDRAWASRQFADHRLAEARRIADYLMAVHELLRETVNPAPERLAQVAERHEVAPQRLEAWWALFNNDATSRDPIWGPWSVLARRDEDTFGVRRASLRRMLSSFNEALDVEHRAALVSFGDFELENFGEWSTEGPAFGDRPCRDPRPDVLGFTGDGFADSGHRMDVLTGRLVSPRWVVDADHDIVTFLMAGGKNPGKTCVNVIVNSQSMPQADAWTLTGANSNQLQRQAFFLDAFMGREVCLEVVDDDPQGHIIVDDFAFLGDIPVINFSREFETNALVLGLLGADVTSHRQLAQAYQRLILTTLEGWLSDVDEYLDVGAPDDQEPPAIRMLKQRMPRPNEESIRSWIAGGSSPLQLAEDLEELLSEDERRELERLRQQREELLRSCPQSAMAIVSRDRHPDDTRVQLGGDPHSPGEIAPRRFLSVLTRPDMPQVTTGSGRLELAEWLASPHNPLTARVLVNRVWQHHFGHGIVATPDNFGLLGERPSHPALLDYLACRFIESGWSLKSLHRMMLLSRTYQQTDLVDDDAFQTDPDNRLVHHMPRRRLEAECIRDAMLACSGGLDRSVGGAPVLIERSPAAVVFDTTFEDQQLISERRTIYLQVRRNALPSFLTAFDFPKPDSCVGQRRSSLVPQQSLTLMNSPFARREAERWATQLLSNGSSDADRVRIAYLQALGRPPESNEVAEATTFIATQTSVHESIAQNAELAAWSDLCHVMFNLGEFLFVR